MNELADHLQTLEEALLKMRFHQGTVVPPKAT